MLSIETTRSLLLSCCTLLLARKNIIAALEAPEVAVEEAGVLTGTAADMLLEPAAAGGSVEEMTTQKTAWPQHCNCVGLNSLARSENSKN